MTLFLSGAGGKAMGMLELGRKAKRLPAEQGTWNCSYQVGHTSRHPSYWELIVINRHNIYYPKVYTYT
jgi:hypothetical protein